MTRVTEQKVRHLTRIMPIVLMLEVFIFLINPLNMLLLVYLEMVIPNYYPIIMDVQGLTILSAFIVMGITKEIISQCKETVKTSMFMLVYPTWERMVFSVILLMVLVVIHFA